MDPTDYLKNSEINELFTDLNNYFEGNLEDNKTIVLVHIQILAELVEVVADSKIQIPSWMFHSQTLISKIIYTSYSLMTLSTEIEYAFYSRPGKIRIFDYSSIFILTRALIENYVIFCYIYNNKLPDEEKIFRFKLWEVSGLISRQNMTSAHHDEILLKKETEKLLIDKILLEIQNLPEYKNLDKSKLNKLKRYGLPRLFTWHELINLSELNNEMFAKFYSYFSTYAHSEFLSILQLSQASLSSNNINTISNVQLSLDIVKMINALSIDYYVINFVSANNVFKSFSADIKQSVFLWKEIGKGVK